jgi:hypothetical protein
MAFLTLGAPPPAKKRRLYLMEITLPSGMQVVKCGVASGSSSKERMMQINSSIYDKFRSTAMIKIKRDKEVDGEDVFKFENSVHKFFFNYQYDTTHKFDGCTECFCVPIEDMVQAYELIIEGVVPDFQYQMPSTKEAEDSLPF